jgi:leucyl/phenylalanyl-tRNA--protein transferase
MPVYRLGKALRFPSPDEAEPDGLLAVGGDLSVERLLLAYRSGIFPWPVEDLPLVWWSPDPRFVLYPDRFHVPKSLERVVRKAPYAITYDRDFAAVIQGCRRTPRPGQPGTWITPAMVRAYERLHAAGHAHSVEAWSEDQRLVGGLYGVAIGGCFFGESMFAIEPDASKCAFVDLVRRLIGSGCALIDCQVHTDHLERFGAIDVPRERFLQDLAAALAVVAQPGPWEAAG